MELDKIPPREYPNIIKLVKQQRWKTLLITIHNRYKVSEKQLLLFLKPIEKKFSKFVDDLQRNIKLNFGKYLRIGFIGYWVN